MLLLTNMVTLSFSSPHPISTCSFALCMHVLEAVDDLFMGPVPGSLLSVAKIPSIEEIMEGLLLLTNGLGVDGLPLLFRIPKLSPIKLMMRIKPNKPVV